jgi:hypothetical protein
VSTDISRIDTRAGVHRSFVGRPSLCEGLRFLRMTGWVEGLRPSAAKAKLMVRLIAALKRCATQRLEIESKGQHQRRRTGVSAPHEFCVDLALRYFVSFLYNLNGFMEPLRTGLSEGAFCLLEVSRVKMQIPRLRSG